MGLYCRYLPEDDPTLFYYFYQTTVNGKCCLAPERFRKIGAASKSDASLPSVQQDRLYIETLMDATVK